MLAGTITLKLSTFFSVSLYSNSILTGKQLPSVESLKEKRTNFQRKTVKEQKKKAFSLDRHFFFCLLCGTLYFCGARDADKLEALNKRILRFILGDYSSPYNTLLSKVSSTSLFNKRIQNFLILLYKSLFFTHFPTYMKNMFSLRSSVKSR